ncbi:MAG TPA: hypothetical protein VLZ75_13335 [Chitinophagales bacterium]|nr:hypothetical protein [Chitinophagales bacterium]
MDNHREQIKKDLNNIQCLSEFEKEAKEGWDNIGMEHWDSIHQKLDRMIDQETSNDITTASNKIHPIKKNSNLSLKLGIAAMIFLTIGLSLTFIFNQPEQNIQLFDAYYKPLDAPEDNFRSEEKVAAINENVKVASDAYDDLDYKKSIAFYSELLKESPGNSKYTLFLGLSYINDGKYDEAILLYNLHHGEDSPYDEDIKWYLALAHLRKGEIQTSKLLLESIAQDSKNYYANTADELATKLAKLK